MSDATGAGSGESATTTEGQPTAGQQLEQTQTSEPQDSTDWKAEAQKWEKRAKADAEKAKANAAAAAELTQLQKAQMSENEKAIAAARDAGIGEAKQQLSGQMVAMAIKAAAAGRLPATVIDKLAETVNPAVFITDDFTVNMEAITELVNGIAPAKAEEKPAEKPADPRFPDIGGQGAKGDLALNGTDGFLAALKASVGREQ